MTTTEKMVLRLFFWPGLLAAGAFLLPWVGYALVRLGAAEQLLGLSLLAAAALLLASLTWAAINGHAFWRWHNGGQRRRERNR